MAHSIISDNSYYGLCIPKSLLVGNAYNRYGIIPRGEYVRQGGVVQRSIVSAASVIAVVLLYDLFAGDIDYKKVFYSSQLWCFELLIYINLITEIIWPSGMYSANSGHFLMRKCYFLGYYNNHTMWFVPALLFAWLYASETRKYFRAVVLTAAIVASALITWSGGVLASLGAMIIVFVLTKRRSWRIFNYYFYWLIHILFFVWVILLNTNNIISRLVESLFHKGHSFDLRISLWAKYVMLIGNHWFTGYGIWDQMYREDQVGFYWGMHAHNMILEILYQGGIVYLVMFVALVLMSGKMLMIESQESRIISIAFLGWIVATLVEPFAGGFLMGMFIIAYYSNTNTEFVEASSGLETYIMRN